jgi:hypothetical protein
VRVVVVEDVIGQAHTLNDPIHSGFRSGRIRASKTGRGHPRFPYETS